MTDSQRKLDEKAAERHWPNKKDLGATVSREIFILGIRHCRETEVKEAKVKAFEKAAEIARYHSTKMNNLVPAYLAACKDIEVSCLATASRVGRGEGEDPATKLDDWHLDPLQKIEAMKGDK